MKELIGVFIAVLCLCFIYAVQVRTEHKEHRAANPSAIRQPWNPDESK